MCGSVTDNLRVLQPTAVPDPWTIVAEFKQAALNAKEAGFDGVECMLFIACCEHSLILSLSSSRCKRLPTSSVP